MMAGAVMRGSKGADPANAPDANLASVLAADADEAAEIVSRWSLWCKDRMSAGEPSEY